MSSVMTITDVVQLVVLCALVFIPLGYWLVPRAVAFVRWLCWRLFQARRFRHMGALNDYLKQKNC